MTFTTHESPPDLAKMLGEWALAAGRYFQSPQTGYVHHYYGEVQQGAQTIPLVENVLFVLALLRSRLMEQVQEAKGLLKKVLVFQNQEQKDASYGNFPIYLHEYPACQDATLGLQLLAPFYWILKQFSPVLGAELKQQLEQAAQLALEHSLGFHRLKPFPYSFAVRLAAAQFSYGLLWEHQGWQQEGQEQLDQLAQRQLEGWQTTKHLGDMLVGLQMVYSSLAQSVWNPLWQRMEQTWHKQTGCYIGPCVREWQEREEPQSHLYDLYASYFAGQFPRRTAQLRPYHLQAALIRPSSYQFNLQPQLFVEGEFKQQKWQTRGLSGWAYTLLEKKEPYQPSQDKTYTPFRLLWGDLHRAHSFVCQGGNYEKVEYVQEEDSLKLLFDLNERKGEEQQPPQREIEFFVDFHPDLIFTLNGHSANTFEVGQTLTFSFSTYRLLLRFDLMQGEGTFLGHLMRGNRPSQFDLKGDKRFQSYDWTCFLRTIRRQSRCRLQVTLSFQDVDCSDSSHSDSVLSTEI